MKLLLISALLSFSLFSIAQTEIDPISDSHAFRMESFTAEYAQMGSNLIVSTSFSSDQSMYNVTMSMPDLSNRSRIITDVIGISAADGSFAYRDFHLMLPAWSFNRVRYEIDKILIESFTNEGVEKNEKQTEQPVFDGTFAYWQLSGIDPSVDSFVLRRWKQTPQGLVVGLSTAPFVLNGKKEVIVGREKYDCRIYEVEIAAGTKVICYVSDQAPYLIRQEYQQGEANPSTILELSRVLK